VRYWQRTTDSIVPFLSIARLVKQISDDINAEENDPDRRIRFKKEAIVAFRDAAEDHLNILFRTIHAGRVTMKPKDIHLTKNIVEMHGIKVYQPWDKQQSINMLQKRMTHSLS
jgi:histone H3/H4